jgi:hypothetical protein
MLNNQICLEICIGLKAEHLVWFFLWGGKWLLIAIYDASHFHFLSKIIDPKWRLSFSETIHVLNKFLIEFEIYQVIETI